MSGRFTSVFVESLEPRQLFTVALLGQLNATVAEQLAREVAYRNLAVGAQVQFQGQNIPYTVSKVFTDARTGFDALGLTSAENGPCLVLRGSEFFASSFQLKDLLSDADSRGVGYDQFSANWATGTRVRDWLKAQNAPVDFVGHSLGGALAQWFAAAWSNATDAGAGAGDTPVDQVYTFCSPGISDSRIVNPKLITYASGAAGVLGPAGFNEARANNVEHYIALGDIVSMAGEKYIAGSVKTYSWSDPNLINKHIRPLLNAAVQPQPNEGNIAAPNPAPTVGALTSAQLSAASYVHADNDYLLTVLGLELAAVALALAKPDLFGPLPLAPPLLLRRDLTEASRKVLGEMLRVAADGLNITKVGDEVKITYSGQQGSPLLKATTFFFDPVLTATIDAANPKDWKFNGKMRIGLPANFQVNTPAGAINVQDVLGLPQLDATAVVDPSGMKVNGIFSVMNGVASLDGMAKLDFRTGTLDVTGAANFLGGLVNVGNGTLTVSGNGDVAMSGAAGITLPNWAPAFAGRQLAGGSFDFVFSNDGNLANDYIEARGTTLVGLFQVTAGLRQRLDGSLPRPVGGIGLALPRPASALAPSVARQQGAVGASFSVPAGQAWLILDAAFANPGPSAQVRVVRPDGEILDEPAILAAPDITLLPELTGSRGRAVGVEAPAPGTWRIEVVDDTGLGTVRFAGLVPAPTVSATFDPITTGGLRRETVPLRVLVDDPTGLAAVALYVDRNGSGADGDLIAAGLAPVNGVVEFDWNPIDVPVGDAFLYAVVTAPDSPAATAYAAAPVRITERRPVVRQGEFLFEDFQAVRLTFDQQVGGSLALGDFTLTNQTTGAVIPSAQVTLAYDEFSAAATLRFPGSTAGGLVGVLPDGVYLLSAPAGSITNADGESLATDLAFSFHVLAGDADRDGDVDLADFSLMAAEFNSTEQAGVFSGGNFDYGLDRVTNINDFAILASNFNASLPLPRPSADVETVAAIVPAAAPSPAVGGRVFSATPVSAGAPRIRDDLFAPADVA
jgi:hypothetical protein